jgi:hypothetical protein
MFFKIEPCFQIPFIDFQEIPSHTILFHKKLIDTCINPKTVKSLPPSNIIIGPSDLCVHKCVPMINRGTLLLLEEGQRKLEQFIFRIQKKLLLSLVRNCLVPDPE